MATPVITKMEVYPVAGKDCMEPNLSGVHAPYFTRNAVALYADSGGMGVGEVLGGQKITGALEECTPMVKGIEIGECKSTLSKIKRYLDSKGEEDVRGSQTSDLRTGVHVITAIETPCLDSLGKYLDVPARELLGDGQQRDKVGMLGYPFFVGDRNKTDLAHDVELDVDYQWYRIRHEEVLIADKTVAFARTTKEKYGSQDFKLKGEVLARNEETEVICTLKKEPPDVGIGLDPNGGWLLEEAVECVKGMQDILTYYENPCGAEGVYSGRKIMSELHRRTGLPTVASMITTDWREVGHSLEPQAVNIILADPHFWIMNGSVRVAQMCHDLGCTRGSYFNNHFDILLAVSTQVEVVVPGEYNALDTHWIWQEGLECLTKKPLQIVNGCVETPRKSGFGIGVDPEQVKKVRQLYLDNCLGDRDDFVVV